MATHDPTIEPESGAGPQRLGELLRFTVDSGTWVSLDLMAEAETAVFDLLGDLYTLDLDSGATARLTGGGSFDTQPRVSPDGRMIAYVSDADGADNLWVMDCSGGSRRQLSDNWHTLAISPSWSPDGERILVAECLTYLAEPRLRWYSLAGDAEDLQDAQGQPVMGVGGIVSPDGAHVYYSSRHPDDELRYLMPIAQLRRMDLASGRVETLTQGRGGGVRPTLSPDGRQLLYAARHESRTGLRSRDLDTGSDRLLIWPVQDDRQDYGRSPRQDHFPGYAVTKDGEHVLLCHAGGVHRHRISDGSSAVIPLHVDVSLEVAPRGHRALRVERGDVRARIFRDPAWTPDRRRVAFSALNKIYIAEVGSELEPTRLTDSDGVEVQPVWSPDGRTVAFIDWRDRTSQIWLASVGPDRSRRRLTQASAFYTDLAFSPDGTQLAAMRGVLAGDNVSAGDVPDSLDLVLLDVRDSQVHVVQTAHGGRHPHFGPDPDRIFTTDGHSLCSIARDGSDERCHLTLRGRFSQEDNVQPAAESIQASPNGTQALALVNKQLWRLPLPADGDDPLVIDVRAGYPEVVKLTEVGADYFGWSVTGDHVLWSIGSTVHVGTPDIGGGPLDRDPATLVAQPLVRIDRESADRTLVLRGAHVIAMVDQGVDPHPRDVDLLIEGDRISRVEPAGRLTYPSSARVIDLTGRFVLPGFVDTHAHWCYPAPELALPDNWSLRANLAYGVTAGLDVQSDHVANFVYQDLVEAGLMVGPRAYMTGPGVFGVNNYKPYEADFTSYQEAKSYLERYRDHYRVHRVKLYLSGNRLQRQWLIRACHELGLLATTEGFGDPVLHLTHAIDGADGNEHALSDSAVHADVIETLARTRTSHTSTLTITHFGIPGLEYFISRRDVQNDPKLNRFYPREVLLGLTARRRVWGRDNEFRISTMAETAAKIQRAGGLVGVGSHGELQGLGYHWEMEMLTMGGLSPSEVLRAATRDGAEVIGFGADLGTLEEGKLADLVVLSADPLVDIRNTTAIVQVMKGGVLYDGDTLEVL